MLDELKELILQVSHLIPVIWFHCEGCFKVFSRVIKYTYLDYLKVVPWFVFAIYGLLVLMVYWAESYSDSCQTCKMEHFEKLVNN